MEFFNQVRGALTSAKNYTAEHYINKELGKRKNTGARSQHSFGGASPTPRMAGAAGVKMIVGELLKDGVDTYVKPLIQRKAVEIKRNRTLDNHQKKGGRLMVPASVGI